MSVVTEDNVSTNILSFTQDSFLFIRTVCKAWHKNGGDTNTQTHANRAVDSISTFEEACEHGYPSNVYAPYLSACRNNSDISVFRHLVKIGQEWCHEDVWYAVEHNRMDVLKLYQMHGEELNEKILHTAVRYGHLEIIEYLLCVNCPVDSTLIEWGFGKYVVAEIKMRSMDIAVLHGRVDIVKKLRTVDYPFIAETFEAAIDGGNIDMLKYLKEDESEYGEDDPYFDEFIQLVADKNYAKVQMLLENDLIDCIFSGVYHAFMNDDRQMIELLVKYMDNIMDYFLVGGNLDLAKCLFREHDISPTSSSYSCVLSIRATEEWVLETLYWLYDEVGCKPESSKCLTRSLIRESPVVQQWFRDRL